MPQEQIQDVLEESWKQVQKEGGSVSDNIAKILTYLISVGVLFVLHTTTEQGKMLAVMQDQMIFVREFTKEPRHSPDRDARVMAPVLQDIADIKVSLKDRALWMDKKDQLDFDHAVRIKQLEKELYNERQN